MTETNTTKNEKNDQCKECNGHVDKCDYCNKTIGEKVLCLKEEQKHFCSNECAHNYAKKNHVNFLHTHEDGNQSTHIYNPTNMNEPNDNIPANAGKKTADAINNARQKTANILNNASNAALSGLRNAGKAVGGSGDSSSHSSSSGSTGAIAILFVVSMIIHIMDAITKFDRPGFVLYYYIGLIIFSFFFIFNMKINDSDERKLLIIIALSYLLPYTIKYLPDNQWVLAISGVLFLFPLLPLYIGLQAPENSFLNKFSRLYMVFWIIVLAFYLIATFAPTQTSTAQLKGNVFAGTTYVLGNTGKTISGVGTSISNTFQNAVAQATGQPNPGQEESKVGIYIENMKPLESGYTNRSNVYVEAKIKAVNVKEPVKISTICYIPDVHQGITTPSELPEVSADYENIIDCELGQLKEGNYEVRMRATFEFESTADIEYTFVSTNIKTDQYARLNINPTTIATYTGGPVAVGLPSIAQPLRIDVARDEGNIVSYPFGVSLQNKWPQGKVIKGLQYTLNTPKEITLTGCSRDPIETTENNADGRNIYVFRIDTTNAQDVFDAVSCRMKISDIKSLLGNDLKSVKTFAAKATYQYSIESSTNINIVKG